ncbi:hypothetical protein BD626DRAFT_626647 [Schizophyllum amplum]|uniref:SET domain-containing protein n=1 Tax=Schizophyllum amplum TaxID=97359 RepID=A0A550CU78_9AGAR|nr:hypothetical protein BD626DRAFT_626647 [Auriculariopsis ampla]
MKRGFLKNKSLNTAKRSDGPGAPTMPTAEAPAPQTEPQPSARQKATPSARLSAPSNMLNDVQKNLPKGVSLQAMQRGADGRYSAPVDPRTIDLNSLDQDTAAEMLKMAGIDLSALEGGDVDIVPASEIRIVSVPAQRPFVAAVSPRTANKIENSPSLCAPYTVPTPPRHRIARSPVSGLGVFTEQALGRGELVLREPPLMLLTQMIGAEMGTNPVRAMEGILERALAALTPEDRALFMSFDNCKTGRTHSQKRGIADTNTSAITEGGVLKGSYGAVTRELSRLNHSCEPNAHAIWDTSTMTFGLYTTRPVKAGDELFIAYSDGSKSKAERQHELWALYSFRCACSKCSRQ